MRWLSWAALLVWLAFGIALAIQDAQEAFAYLLGSWLTRSIVEAR